MGFEVTYKYHEKKDSSYNKDEVKLIKKKVGDPFEDVPLEKLAAAVMGQLARRDIFVIDVQIVELSKKEISCKESNGGIVIKNKKFFFDSAMELVAQEFEQPSAPPRIQQQSSVSIGIPSVDPVSSRKPIDFMIFSPEPQQMAEIQGKRIKLTIDKKYPIYEKKLNGITNDLRIIDDAGNEQLLSEIYFVPGNIKLVAGELGFNEQKSRDIRLNWNGVVDEGIPTLRR